MFPYFEQPAFSIGPWTIYSFSILEWISALVCWRLLLRRARRDGAGGREASGVFLCAVVAGLAAAHAAKIIGDDPRAFLADPLVVVRNWSGLASFGGLFGGIAGAVCWSRCRGESWSRAFDWLDRLAYVFPFAWIFGRLGCTLAHDHRGAFTTSWLAFRYPEGPRYNLGLIEVLFTAALGVLFLRLERRRPPRGIYLALAGLLYGAFRLWLDTLHDHAPRYFGWTVDQLGAAPLVLVGAAALVAVSRQQKSGRLISQVQTGL